MPISHEIPVGAQVVLRQSPLAGVVGEAAELGSGVEGQYGIGRQRTEAHRRNIEQSHVVGLGAVGSADPDPGRVAAHRSRGHGRREEFATGPVQIEFGAERLFGVGALGALVDNAPRVTIEGATVEVPLNEVLLELWSQRLHRKSEVPEQGVVPQDGMPTLQEIVRGHQRKHEQWGGRGPPPGPDQNGGDHGSH